MAKIKRLDPQQARKMADRGEADLVCSYEDESKCRKIRLDGAFTLQEYQDRLDDIQEDRSIIFYCA